MILSGKRDPGADLILALQKFYKFNHEEAKYFEGLIKIDKVKSDPLLKGLLYSEMARLSNQQEFKRIDLDAFELMSNWYYSYILELVSLPNFVQDAKWIKKVSRFPISLVSIKKAIKTLEKLGLITKTVDGKLKRIDQLADTPYDIPSQSLKKFNGQMIDLAKEALQKTDVSLRAIQGVTLRINPKKIHLIQSFLRSIDNQLLDGFEETDETSEIYQFNIQFFPLSQINHTAKKNQNDHSKKLVIKKNNDDYNKETIHV